MTPSDDSPHTAAETTARQLELCLQRTVVSAVLRHTDSELGTSCADVTLQLLPPAKMDRTIKRLTEDGYSVGPAPSHEILVKDGQQFTVRFRGNICCEDGRKVRTLLRLLCNFTNSKTSGTGYEFLICATCHTYRQNNRSYHARRLMCCLSK